MSPYVIIHNYHPENPRRFLLSPRLLALSGKREVEEFWYLDDRNYTYTYIFSYVWSERYYSSLGPGRSWGDWCCDSQCTGISSRHVRIPWNPCGQAEKNTGSYSSNIPFTTQIITNSICFGSVKTRLQVQEKRKPTDVAPLSNSAPHYTSTWDAISKIAEEDGFLGLYAGINGALIGVASTNFAYFYWYSIVRTLYISRVPTPPGTLVELGLGAAAGAVAQVFTIPVAVVTTRQQTQSKGERKGMVDTAKDVINSEDGVSGLWRGLKASLVLVVNPAITYGAYQRLREVIYPGKTNLKPLEAFRKLSTAQ